MKMSNTQKIAKVYQDDDVMIWKRICEGNPPPLNGGFSTQRVSNTWLRWFHRTECFSKSRGVGDMRRSNADVTSFNDVCQNRAELERIETGSVQLWLN